MEGARYRFHVVQGNLVAFGASRLATVQEYFPDDCVSYFDDDEELVARVRDIHANHAAALQRAQRAREVAQSISWESDSAKLVEFVDASCNSQ